MEDTTSPQHKSSESHPTQEAQIKTYTPSEIEQHNRIDDIWIIIDNGVYDLTNFVSEHPGGGKSMYYLEVLELKQKT